MQKVALILVAVDSLEQGSGAVDFGSSSVVSGRKQFATEALRMVPECAEFNLAVAQHIGIGCSTSPVFIEKIREYTIPVLL